MAWDDVFGWGGGSLGELRRLQREMDRVFGDIRSDAEAFPTVNIWSSKDAIVVTAELPGMDPKAIGLTVKGDLLTLHGERNAESENEGVICHRSERWSGSFARTLRLPYEVDQEKIQAKYRSGVLTVTLPRSEASRPRQIEIKTEE